MQNMPAYFFISRVERTGRKRTNKFNYKTASCGVFGEYTEEKCNLYAFSGAIVNIKTQNKNYTC